MSQFFVSHANERTKRAHTPRHHSTTPPQVPRKRRDPMFQAGDTLVSFGPLALSSSMLFLLLPTRCPPWRCLCRCRRLRVSPFVRVRVYVCQSVTGRVPSCARVCVRGPGVDTQIPTKPSNIHWHTLAAQASSMRGQDES